MNLYVDFKRHASITISQYWRHLCVTDQRDNFSRSLYSWTSLGRSKNCPLLAISKNAGLSYFHCLMFQTVCHGYNKQTNKQTEALPSWLQLWSHQLCGTCWGETRSWPGSSTEPDRLWYREETRPESRRPAGTQVRWWIFSILLF